MTTWAKAKGDENHPAHLALFLRIDEAFRRSSLAGSGRVIHDLVCLISTGASWVNFHQANQNLCSIEDLDALVASAERIVRIALSNGDYRQEEEEWRRCYARVTEKWRVEGAKQERLVP
ncbi:MAG: hypothetical protein KKC18_06870 [Chloroflexi bacterium]|nr:hypothetical protein [Chloroflexota bacterium]